MADVFDKFFAGVKENVDSIKSGSKDFVEKTQLNAKIKESEKEKKNLLANLGLLVYNLCLRGETQIPQCEEIINEIGEIEETIKKLAERIKELESGENVTDISEGVHESGGGVICSCGFLNRTGANYCIRCGAPLTEEDNEKNL